VPWRFSIVLFNTCLFLGLIVAGFWRQDWQYSLPTPRPDGLQQPSIGAEIHLASLGRASEKPVFLHFFNPDCPCSAFNVDHIRWLIQRFGTDVEFVAVLQGEGGPERLRSEFEKLHLGMKSVEDSGGEVGRATGVYATPQAVLLDRRGRLYYRGNYNLSRYCSVPETEYARLALEALLAGKPPRPVEPGAATAYGCPLKKRAGNS
jgi:hypothetical protein